MDATHVSHAPHSTPKLLTAGYTPGGHVGDDSRPTIFVAHYDDFVITVTCGTELVENFGHHRMRTRLVLDTTRTGKYAYTHAKSYYDCVSVKANGKPSNKMHWLLPHNLKADLSYAALTKGEDFKHWVAEALCYYGF